MTIAIFVGLGAVVAAILGNWSVVLLFLAFGLLFSIPTAGDSREEWEAEREESETKAPLRLW